MGISRSSYYYESNHFTEKLKSDLKLKEVIKDIHDEYPGYGYRRIHEYLLRKGARVNCKRIRRVMKQYSLFTSKPRRLQKRGSHCGEQLVYPNLIAGMKLTGPNQVWATDITFIKLLKGFVYLNAIIDIYTRRIVGWSVSKNMGHEFCLEALRVALRRQKPPEGLIHHSDRGVQYTSIGYINYLKSNGIKPSMSKVATPTDNAFIEAFFKTLKREEVYARKYETMTDVIRLLPKFIDDVYNLKRLHSSLGYLSPDEFESEITKLRTADRPVQKIYGKAV